MTTADWALIISLFSAVISLAGFVWNVWSKFIYPKPRVDVSFSMMTVFQRGEGPLERVLSLSATNMGPIEVTLHCALTASPSGAFRVGANQHNLLNPLHEYPMRPRHVIGPFGGGLPKKIGVGEQFTVYFVPDHEYLATGDYQKIGFTDTFGRYHWAKRISILKALPSIREECKKSWKDWRKVPKLSPAKA